MTAKIKERPIIFSADSVRAIMAGRKTQTRRAVRFKQWADAPVKAMYEHGPFKYEPENTQSWTADHQTGQSICVESNIFCPCGRVGDRLWVREGWGQVDAKSSDVRDSLMYRCDKHSEWVGDGMDGYWKSPIFMPRWASRLTLEIKSVRVERLQDITRKDASSEGCPFLLQDGRSANTDPLRWFRRSWDEINGKKHPWDSNPWVWAIEFERVEQ